MQPSAATGISHLSQELIDKIIDHLFDSYEDHTKNNIAIRQLRACALVSRVFRARSQKHLFTVLSISMAEDEDTWGRLTRLNDVFSMNPRLVSHTRVLSLIIKTPECYGDPVGQYFADPNFVACMTHIDQSGLRDQLSSNLHVRFTTRPSTMANLSHAFETHFVPLPLVSSRLTILEIHGLSKVPIALFDTCRNLKKLVAIKIRLSSFEDSKRAAITDRPLIRELSVTDSDDLIRRTSLCLDNLSKVVFLGNMQLYPGDIMTMRHILARSNSNLSSLESLNFFVKGI